MNRSTVTVYLQSADRTRKAQVTVPRTMRVADIIKASTHRWIMSFHVDYQLANISTGHMLLSNDTLTADKVRDGDVLILQPFPTHGRN